MVINSHIISSGNRAVLAHPQRVTVGIKANQWARQPQEVSVLDQTVRFTGFPDRNRNHEHAGWLNMQNHVDTYIRVCHANVIRK